MLEKLAELESQLSDLSHNQDALEAIRNFASKLKKQERQIIFSTHGSLIIGPICYKDVLAKGLITNEEDPFILLQGDIVGTNAAYLCGERLEGMRFVVASSTCDLVADRREYASLLRIQPILITETSILGELLKFASTKRMFLPRFNDDPSDVIANAIIFDGVIQVKLEDLLMATRYASLSLVGWRIFGSLVRAIMVRTGNSEIRIRTL